MKKPKAIAALLSAALLAGVLTACSTGTGAQASDVFLYEKGLAVIQRIDQLAEDEGYVQAFTGAASLRQIAQQMGAQDYGTPQAVYAITGVEQAYLALLSAQQSPALSEQTRSAIAQRSAASLGNLINGWSGAEQLAASSILAVQEPFVCSGLPQSTVYLYLYEGSYAGMVSFTAHEQEIVTASGCLIRRDVWGDGMSAQDIQTLFQQKLHFTGIQITSVQP